MALPSSSTARSTLRPARRPAPPHWPSSTAPATAGSRSRRCIAATTWPLSRSFGEDEGSPLRQALGPARRLLARAAADIGDADLLVPEVAQLALYDGCKRNLKPGYVAHRDNAATPGAAGENYREVTLLLYLNGAPPGASGGELRAYVGAEPSDLDGDTAVRVDDIQPRAGRLVLFESRTLLHAVRPVGLWRRVALSLWCLKRSRQIDSRRLRISWASMLSCTSTR